MDEPAFQIHQQVEVTEGFNKRGHVAEIRPDPEEPEALQYRVSYINESGKRRENWFYDFELRSDPQARIDEALAHLDDLRANGIVDTKLERILKGEQ